jgi:hypothetical protein
MGLSLRSAEERQCTMRKDYSPTKYYSRGVIVMSIYSAKYEYFPYMLHTLRNRLAVTVIL